MPVQHSPPKDQPAATSEPLSAEDEKARKSRLKAARRARTISRNLMQAELNKIQGLHTENPEFPPECCPEVMTRLINQHAADIRGQNEQISLQIEDDTEWDREALISEEITRECVMAIAAVEVASRRVRESSTASIVAQPNTPTAGQSPEAPTPQQTVVTTVTSTPTPTVGGEGSQSSAETATASVSSVPLQQSSQVSAHLNKLTREYDMTPRKFSGDRLQFRTFIAEFDEYVGRREDVSSLRKLIILRKFLEGEPLIIVEALVLSDANYKVALSLLEKNYSRVGSEKIKIVGEIRNLPAVIRPYDYAAISKLVTTVQSHISVLAVNGVSLSEIALVLLDSLQSSLPIRVRQDFLEQQRADERYARSVAESDGDVTSANQQSQQSAGDVAAKEVEDLIEFLRERLRNLERLKQDTAVPATCEKKAIEGQRRVTGEQRKRPQSTVAAADAKSVNSARAKKPFPPKQCLFCKSADHSSSRCGANMTVAQRLVILRELQRCERCFRPKHASQADCQGPRAECSVCKTKAHYSSMHPDEKASVGGTISAVVSAGVDSHLRDTLLWTASAYVVNDGMRVPVRIFVDPGSSITVAAPSLCKQIRDPPIGYCDITIQAFVNCHSRTNVPIRALRLSGPTRDSEIVITACEHDLRVDPANSAPARVIDAIRDFNRRLPVADRSYLGEWNPDAPTVLLGMDQAHKLMVNSKSEHIIDEIQAHKSRFGWIIGGPIARTRSERKHAASSSPLVCCAATRDHRRMQLTRPAEDLQKLWTLETIGIETAASSQSLSADEESALAQFHASLIYSNNRYTVAIPKRPTIATLLNNHDTAARRLERKLVQLESAPERYRRYHEELLKFVDSGFAIEISKQASTISCSNDGSFYMPHHEVVTTSGSRSAEKWRIVFDCSAKTKGATSLNHHLLVGPRLDADLLTLLLNFRAHKVAVSADITQAYMQIAVTEEDQRYFRFLWKFPGEHDIRTFQMQRVTWGAAPSGFLLAAVLREHFRRSQPSVEDKYGPKFYADDYLASYPDASTAMAATSELRRVLETAGMHLAKWKSSSAEVIGHLLDCGVQESSMDTGSEGVFKVLGVSWSATEDTFRFRVPDLRDRILPERMASKREALSIVASLFDPLGWLTPFSLRGKLIIQRIWAAGLEWNQPISPDIQRELTAWTGEIEELRTFHIPRQFIPGTTKPISHHLHVFGDASPLAFAACAFVEGKFEDGSSMVTFIMSKSRLAPLQKQSLPRLELLASVMAVRLRRFLTERLEISFDSVRLYTDSMITYHWVTSECPGRWKTFVHNRVREVQENSRREEWFHVPGDMNVSDLATRGVPVKELLNSSVWWNGPEWLHLPENRRPTSQPKTSGAESAQSVESELRTNVASVISSSNLVDIEQFGSLMHAVRVVAFAIQFTERCRRRPERKLRDRYRLAEMLLIRETQRGFFAEEIALARTNEPPPSSSKLASFVLFIDQEGVLRAKTRLNLAPMLSYDEMNPIVLPGESRLARLYILEAHRINAHFGVATVLAYLRRRLWVTRARQVIKSLLRNCVVCRKSHGRKASQVEAQLPLTRVDLQSPFATTGVDFAGPFYTKGRDGVMKTYMALFTCFTVRAVHLEAVPSMSAPQTSLAIRRFLALYPACERFVSDNGRSFIKASTDLKRLFNSVRDPATRDVLQDRVVDWNFNCPRASWHGGTFEKMIGIVKTSLYKTLGKSLIGFEEFRTILCELGAIVNSRPLSYATNDADEPTPITPAHFLKGGTLQMPLAGLLPVDRLASDECATAGELRQGIKHRTTYFRSLSARWLREYLLLLRTANSTRGSVKKPIAVGDVCLLRDENVPRIKWQLVKIIEQHVGRDGNVRVYTIRLPNGKTTRRAAQLLYPLEVCDNSQVSG